MIKKTTLLLFIFQIFLGVTYAQIPDQLIAPYGPPDTANQWTKYTIPLTAESFNIADSIFQAAITNITSLWIRTEMHSGYDLGGLDEVKVGDVYSSYFDISSESWTSGGDGTMSYIQSGGVNGGYLQIEDWASGDWHYLITPFSWAGDWSALIGQNVEFWMKTDKPSYAADIRLTTGPVSRLALVMPNSSTVAINDSVLIEVGVDPVPTQDVTVNLTTSSATCITIPSQIVVPAGQAYATVYATTASGATMGCQSVIEATSSGYLTSRMTIKVDGYAGINDMVSGQEVSVSPNPIKDVFTIINTSGKKIKRITVYDIHTNIVLDLKGNDLSNANIRINDQPAGVYLLKMYMQDKVLTSKVIIQ
jgi:hypothetical protein